LQREGDVFVLRIDAGENRFSFALLAEIGAALDQVEQAGAPAALVTTGSGKFYSNGLDVEWMMAHPAQLDDYLAQVLGLAARLLTFPATTVAAINGHAFGAGALLALAHDFRLMRADRGYFCMPEVDMKIPLHPGMVAILQARLPAQTAHEVIATGKRWGGNEAVARGIVDEALAEDQLMARATAVAAPLASKADPILRTLKSSLYARVIEAVKARLT
jgi:enoyl-CoA hydratase/carnithine racemase